MYLYSFNRNHFFKNWIREISTTIRRKNRAGSSSCLGHSGHSLECTAERESYKPFSV